MRKYPFVLVVVLVLVAVTVAGIRLLSSGAEAQTPPAVPFNPSFGDLMNTLVQPRHAKLGLIGREQNWVLAAYEMHQLKDALTNIGKWKPRFRNMPVPELMQQMTGEPVKAIEQAIEARNAQGFAEAYERLTAGCNACHAALNHAHVVIRAPDRSSFANQDFRAAK